MTVRFLPFRQQIVIPETGHATREFWLFLQDAFDLSGDGAVTDDDIALVAPASNSDALATSIFGLAGDIDALGAQVGQLPSHGPQIVTVDDLMPIISGLRDEIAMLRAEVSNLQLGAVVL
jgi:hypothetical protein